MQLVQSSYSTDDVVFLLKDLTNYSLEIDTEKREHLIQSGVHYSEMLPVEYQPTSDYIDLYHKILEGSAKLLASYIERLAKKIKAYHRENPFVLVSLARAGTPIGILIRRYFSLFLNEDLPHYSISIVRGKGLDEVAIEYIQKYHPGSQLQFIDGWTGKGAITLELQESCKKYNSTHASTPISPNLAVISDPAECAHLSGTRKDFLIPSACLNSTVSGLVSRTVLNEKYIKEGQFHGAKYYKDLEDVDVSNQFLRTVENYFSDDFVLDSQSIVNDMKWSGLQAIKGIQQQFGIQSIHSIKPGVGETTRVLLRRVPSKILIHPAYESKLSHIILLAEEKNVPIERFEHMTYACCGLIKEFENE